MKFNMIVLMTSCDPNRALSTPGIAPQIAPATIATMQHNGSNTTAGKLAKGETTACPVPGLMIETPPNLIPTQAVAKAAK